MKQNDVGINIQPPVQAEGNLRASLKEWMTVKANISNLNAELKRLGEIEEGFRGETVHQVMAYPNQEVAVGEVTIVASITPRDTPKYKDAFELALTKVNEATQIILTTSLAASTSHSEKPELKVKAGKKLKVKAIQGTVVVA